MPVHFLFPVTTSHFHVIYNSVVYTYIINFSSQQQVNIFGSEERSRCPELKPTTANPGSHSNISISIHRQHVPRIAELIQYFYTRTIINIHTRLYVTISRTYAMYTLHTRLIPLALTAAISYLFYFLFPWQHSQSGKETWRTYMQYGKATAIRWWIGSRSCPTVIHWF